MEGRPTSAVDPIETEDDRKKVRGMLEVWL